MLHILICVPNQNPENSDEQLTGNFIKTIVKMSRKKKKITHQLARKIQIITK